MACPLRLQKARRPIPVVKLILPVHSVWLGTRTQARPGGCHSFLRFRRWPSAPAARRYGRIDTGYQCLDVMGHRTDAVGSQQLVGTITQARAAVAAALSFVRHVIE